MKKILLTLLFLCLSTQVYGQILAIEAPVIVPEKAIKRVAFINKYPPPKGRRIGHSEVGDVVTFAQYKEDDPEFNCDRETERYIVKIVELKESELEQYLEPDTKDIEQHDVFEVRTEDVDGFIDKLNESESMSNAEIVSKKVDGDTTLLNVKYTLKKSIRSRKKTFDIDKIRTIKTTEEFKNEAKDKDNTFTVLSPVIR